MSLFYNSVVPIMKILIVRLTQSLITTTMINMIIIVNDSSRDDFDDFTGYDS